MIQAVVVVIKADTAICLENKTTLVCRKGKKEVLLLCYLDFLHLVFKMPSLI